MIADKCVKINSIVDGRPAVTECNMTASGVAFYDGYSGNSPASLECKKFYDAVRFGTEPSSLPEQAYCVTRILEGIYESAKTGNIYFFD